LANGWRQAREGKSDGQAGGEPGKDTRRQRHRRIVLRITAGAADVASGLHVGRREDRLMLTIVFVCLLLWFLGLMTSYTLGGVLHILLVVAIVLFLVHIIQGSSIGNA
jgi:hypothetical protein